MFVVLLPLVAIAAVVAWALGVPGRRVALAAGGVAVLLVVATVLVGAFALSEERGDVEGAGRGMGSGRTRPPDLVLRPPDGRATFPPPSRAVTGLADGDTVLIEAHVGRGRAVWAAQCEAGTSRCAPGIPVQPDDEGVARTLVALERRIPGGNGEVDCRRRSCSLVLADGEVLFAVPLVFGPAVPVPKLTVAGAGAVRPDDTLFVVLRDFPPGPATVTVCAPPGPSDPTACGAPAPEVVVDVPSSGAARIRYPVEAGPVGSGGGTCRRGHPCALAVPGVAADPVELSFTGLAHADPPGRRVATGLAVAAVLLLVAGWLLRRTDWAPVEGDPFAGVVLDDPFDDIDLDDPDPTEMALDRY